LEGDYYLWHDVSGLHIWASDGYDGWDEAGWHRVDDGKDYPVQPTHLKDGENNASGVSIHQEIVDEYVVMRLAQMIEEGIVDATIERASEAPSFRGSSRLQRVLQGKAPQIKEALRGVAPDKPEQL